jgi:hypothetical protein
VVHEGIHAAFGAVMLGVGGAGESSRGLLDRYDHERLDQTLGDVVTFILVFGGDFDLCLASQLQHLLRFPPAVARNQWEDHVARLAMLMAYRERGAALAPAGLWRMRDQVLDELLPRVIDRVEASLTKPHEESVDERALGEVQRLREDPQLGPLTWRYCECLPAAESLLGYAESECKVPSLRKIVAGRHSGYGRDRAPDCGIRSAEEALAALLAVPAGGGGRVAIEGGEAIARLRAVLRFWADHPRRYEENRASVNLAAFLTAWDAYQRDPTVPPSS